MGLYVGAYLEIKVKKKKNYLGDVYECDEGHQHRIRATMIYCPICGGELKVTKLYDRSHPTHVDDIIDTEKYRADVTEHGYFEPLSEITPMSMFGKGTILAKANTTNAGHWYQYRRGDGENDGVTEMPTEQEVAEKIAALVIEYATLVAELRESPHTEEVNVKFGIVPDEEY